jgi:calcineurin-like phosphoesterase family protein
MIYFTADWHLGDNRIGVEGKPNLLQRPFSSVLEMNETIIGNFCKTFKDGDTLYHLGDVLYSTDYSLGEEYLAFIRKIYPNSKFVLIEGNYDTDKLDVLGNYFDEIHKNLHLKIDGVFLPTYLDHYPVNCADMLNDTTKSGNLFTLTGHIHGLWKIQRNMINVGVDVWHFLPVSVNQISFNYNAMINHFVNDKNVCVGRLLP